MEEAAAYHSGVNGKDALLARRAEFMYNFFDYDNDRERVRTRFLEEANKRTTLKDIVLDRPHLQRHGPLEATLA